MIIAIACAAAAWCFLGVAAGDVIIDNGGVGTSFTGTWEISGGSNPYGKDSVWARDGAKYRWAFDSKPAGAYEVLMWWSQWPSRAAVVDVEIVHGGGSQSLVVNQQAGAGQWNSLGTYYFDSSGSVIMTAAYGATVSTCADAVWFKQVTGGSGGQAVEVIVDNRDSKTSKTGSWETSGGANPYGADSVFSRDGATFTWYFTPSQTGNYQVSMWWTEWPSRSTSVPVYVIHAGGTSQVAINQQSGGGRWNTLGTYNFTAGAQGSVTLSAPGAAPTSYCADAVKFTFGQGADTPSTVIIDNGDPATSSTGSWLPSGASEYYGANSLYSRDGTTYTWTFTPPATGLYTLSMWWTEWPSRTTSAKVSVAHVNGTATAYVNQQTNGGRWNKIGEYSYVAGKQYNVIITSSYGSASTCADAVRFAPGSQSDAPKAGFYAERVRGGAPFAVQFRDQSTGEATQWQWDFGDGQTSSQHNPSHTYTKAGLYTVSLKATGPGGANTKTRYDYIDIKPTTSETIYLVDGYAGNNYFLSDIKNVMRNLGATEITNGWRYKPSNSNMTYYLQKVNTPQATENALKEKDAHVVLVGHANFGFGMTFVSSSELVNQTIDSIRYVDDDRFVKYSTDCVAATPENVKYEAAYPNWAPVLKDGRSALMPYDFGDPRGNPPYNYYLTYKIPGDSTLYRIEKADGSYVQRFPGLSVPAWYSASGSPPDPAKNPQYFIRNTDTHYNRFEYSGEWVIRSAGSGFVGHNYQVQWRGSGTKAAKWTIVVKQAGQYQVLATWPALYGNATNARYTIRHANGSTVVLANQASGSGRHSLGVFNFNSGVATVELSDYANGQVIADAIILKNYSGEIYTDNTFQYKPHIKTSNSSGRIICYTGDSRIRSEDLKYSRLFHSSCKSLEYFGGTLNRGVMYGKRENVKVEHDTAVPYLEYYLRGYTDSDILNHVNKFENIHEFINFNEKPPSMRKR